MSEDEDNGKAETTVIDKGIDKEIKEKRIEECIQSWKSEKRSAKSRMTRLLNNMAAMILDGGSEPSEIKDLLLRIDEQKEETLDVMNNLEKVYMEKSDQVNATKVSDEADALVDQVDSETGSARVYLMSLAKKLSHLNSVTVRKDSETKESEVSESQKRKEESRKRTEQWVRLRKERMEMEVQKRRKELQEQERQLQELREVEEDENRSQELNEQNDGEMVDEKESVERKDEQNDGRSETQQTKETNVLMESPEITTIKDKPSTKEIGAATPQAQLERIRIPVFSGNKMEFQKWHAAFTSCVDLTPLSPQFKMLRLEASLTGEAADTIKGLGYSEEAYKAAKARLVRKYGGSRRQVQSHLEELKKLKPIEENNSKELEKFADILERAVITLKENGRESDLESGVLHTIIVEKIPERLLAQYYRWIKENHHQDSLEKLKDWVAEEAEYQIHATEIRKGIGSDSEKRKDRKPRLYFNRDGDTKERSPCPVCSGDHPIWKCNDFRNHSIDEKWKIAKKAGLCYRCLGKGHLGGSCPRSRQCNIDGCRENHNRLLHGDRKERYKPRFPGREENNAEKPKPTEIPHPTEKPKPQESTRDKDGEKRNQLVNMETIGDHENVKIALRTVPIILKNGERKILVNCLLDEGSDATYINEDIVEELGLIGEKKRIEIKVANNETVSFMSNTIQIGLESLDGRVDTEIVAKTSEKICGGMKAVNWLKIKQNWRHFKNIPFPKLAKGNQIDVLLGADNYELMYSMKEIVGEKDEPVARLCPLGWTAVGNVGQCNETGYAGVSYSFKLQTVCNETSELNATLKRFWDLETIGVTPSKESVMTPDEKLAWEKVSSTLKFDGEHYEVSVPWKENRPDLPNNLPLAKQRLLSTEKKLLKDKGLAVAYQQVLNEYLTKQYIRKVPKEEVKPELEWFLPHFPVVRPERASTKVRIVFDGSAPYEGKSLNTEALPGPKLQSNVVDILVKFRKEPVALAGDISQMYHQLVLREEDRPLHRFLWRDLDSSKEPEVYEFLRFVFGGCYCPFCAQYTWQRHAQDHKDEYPLAADAVERHCYMDDVMPSMNTVETAKETRRQLSEMGDKAGFHICKWVSNHAEVLEDIPTKDRSSKVDLYTNQLPITKTLGLTWDAQDDEFLFYYTSPLNGFQYTKRNVLKKTATLFDPLGLLSPFVVKAKLYLQQAWLDAIGWDEDLPDKLKEEWKNWFEGLPLLQEIKIPRCLKNSDPVANVSLHTFSDASEKAYSAAVYSRHEYQDESVSTRLIASKTRLAPLKAISIPRLELMGALIGVRLTKQISLSLEIPMKDVTFWVDSMNVHYWIHGRSRDYKPFVAHRVGEIHEESSPEQWKYVPTELNPADFGTRGLDVCELKNSQEWWYGPEFLQKSKDAWPHQKIERKVNAEASNEMKAEVRVQVDVSEKVDQSSCLVTGVQVQPQNRLDPSRYSKWYRINNVNKLELGRSLVRVRSWVQRFINNCRLVKEERTIGELTTDELHETENKIIQEAQLEVYPEEIKALKKKKSLPKKSSILTFTPIIMDGLLRSNTRLRYSDDLPNSVKYPVILPKKHSTTGLIVKYHHEKEGHEMGLNYTLNHLREKYLIVHGREMVKKVIHDCMECKRRFKRKPITQQMAPLPSIRLEVTMKPFSNCAVDFAGPYITVQGRGKSRTKRYLCLFLCLQTHCVHLEMAWSLETDGFLNALTRMVARRGCPSDMLSDNGTNFVGGNNELRELVRQLDQDKIQRVTSNNSIKWHWNPPLAPHFGGIFERMIKSAKRAIAAILGNADVKDEELMTVITGVESLLNSRPLTAPSNDPNDEPVLTPNHFLIGHMGGDVAPENVDHAAFNPRKRWRRIQELIRHVWKRWMREYLTSIGSRQKWFHREENVKDGDVVLVIDPSTPRRKWKVGKIVGVHPGGDGLVRVVDVKVGDTTYRRAISRISKLEF